MRLGLVGSSPRVRGKLQSLDIDVLKEGLIPACAGKTDDRQTEAHVKQAHPRVCGENFKDGGSVEPQQGSSPRVRGKL